MGGRRAVPAQVGARSGGPKPVTPGVEGDPGTVLPWRGLSAGSFQDRWARSCFGGSIIPRRRAWQGPQELPVAQTASQLLPLSLRALNFKLYQIQ